LLKTLANILREKPRDAAGLEEAMLDCEEATKTHEAHLEGLVARRRDALLDSPDALPGIEKAIAESEAELVRLREGLVALQTRHEQAVKEEFGKYLEGRAEQARADAENLFAGYRRQLELLRELGELAWRQHDLKTRIDAINRAVAEARRPDLRVDDPWRRVAHAAPSWCQGPIGAVVPGVYFDGLNGQGGRRENLTAYTQLIEAIDAVTPASTAKRQAKRA
jgi:hypothetical protein